MPGITPTVLTVTARADSPMTSIMRRIASRTLG